MGPYHPLARTDAWETGFVAVTDDQAPFAQVDSHTSAAARAWLAARTRALRAGIEVVIDPHGGYAAAVRATLPAAAIAMDHSHMIVLVNKAVTTVRPRVTRGRSTAVPARPTPPGPCADSCCASGKRPSLAALARSGTARAETVETWRPTSEVLLTIAHTEGRDR